MTRTTIKDIANAVGVSHTTVSYVLNKNPKQKISEKTRAAVLAAAKELNYIPNETARSLRKNRTRCIAVALENSITHSRFYGILQGIREELMAKGYGLLLMDFQSRTPSKNPDYLDSVLQRRTDGVIYISSDGTPPTCSSQIAENHLPFVCCDCCPDEEEIASVSFDYEKGALEIACRLLGEGVTKLLYWHLDVDTLQEQYRIAGLEQALQLYPKASLEICKLPYLSHDDLSQMDSSNLDDVCQQSLVESIIPKLSSSDEKVAIICSQGIMVKNLCAALYHTQPDKYKIALLSDSEVPLIPGMKILTSRPRFINGGRECAKLLLAQINEEDIPNRIVLPPNFPTYI